MTRLPLESTVIPGVRVLLTLFSLHMPIRRDMVIDYILVIETNCY